MSGFGLRQLDMFEGLVSPDRTRTARFRSHCSSHGSQQNRSPPSPSRTADVRVTESLHEQKHHPAHSPEPFGDRLSALRCRITSAFHCRRTGNIEAAVLQLDLIPAGNHEAKPPQHLVFRHRARTRCPVLVTDSGRQRSEAAEHPVHHRRPVARAGVRFCGRSKREDPEPRPI